MKKNSTVFFIFSILAASLQLHADVQLNRIFSSNMVLQHGKAIRIWGTADAGEKVTVTFHEQSVSTSADSEGAWNLELPAMPPCSTPASLVAKGKNSIKLDNILVGDVWIASGQSNMQWPVSKSLNPDQEIAASGHPNLRLFVVERVHSPNPTNEVASKEQWTPCAPETVPNFSGVAYFFARDVLQSASIPLGIIHCNWGGTCIETWMSKDGLVNSAGYPAVKERWDVLNRTWPTRLGNYEKRHQTWLEQTKSARLKGEKVPPAPKRPLGPDDRNAPNRVYNAMLHPLLPLSIRGVIWYQGEANAARPDSYKDLFQSLITQWRHDFNQGDFPFYFVQLANYQTPNHYAWLREAQAAALSLPATGMAVAIDVGEEKNIHPANKQTVGDRLARIALTHVYGKKNIEWSGPVYAGHRIDKSSIRIRFSHAEGLINRPSDRNAFEIAGADRIFHPATAKVDGNELVVSSPEVKAPVAVRYAWSSYPSATLYNGAGLPASPFRTDDWPRE